MMSSKDDSMILIIVNHGKVDLTFQLFRVGKKKISNTGVIKPGSEFTVDAPNSIMKMFIKGGGWSWIGFIPSNIKAKINCYPDENKVMYRGWVIPPAEQRSVIVRNKYAIIAGLVIGGLIIALVLRKGLK